MKRTRREFLLSSTAVGALLSGRAEARSGRGNVRAGGAGSGPPPPQVIASVTVGGSSSSATFHASTANADVGAIGVVMSPASPPFAGTISLDGGGHNTEGFHLTSSTLPSNLQAPPGGLGLGAYTDVIIRAQQAGLSDLTINPTLTAVNFQPSVAGSLFYQQPFISATSTLVTAASPKANSSNAVSVISGTVTLQASTTPGSLGAGTIVDFLLDNVPIPGARVTGPPFTYSWNTTGTSDGTHVIDARLVDSPTDNVYSWRTSASQIIILNGSPAGISPSVAQTVVSTTTGAGGEVAHCAPSMADFVPYLGSPASVSNTAYPTSSYPTIPPATADSRYMGANAALLRSEDYFYREPTTEYVWSLYGWTPSFETTQNGGVFTQPWTPQLGSTTLTESYNIIIRQNAWDGGRLDNQISPYIEWEEHPDGLGFVGAEVNGRISKYTWDGAVTTLFGFKRDRSVLNIDSTDLTLPEGSITRVAVGTCIGFDDLGGCNDLCFDPTNSNLMYVCCSINNSSFIAVVNLSGGTISGIPALSAKVYAGIPGVLSYVDNVPALSATFNNPLSICIVTQGGGADPVGTMYVADQFNNAIRKITQTSPGIAGTVTTLVGGSLRTNPADFAAYTAGFSTYCPASISPVTNAYIMQPAFIRITSNMGIMCGEQWNNTVRYINLMANTVTTTSNGFQGNPIAASVQSFKFLDCDYKGTCGPVDDVVTGTANSGGSSANVTFWRFGTDGYSGNFNNGGRYEEQGVLPLPLEGLGHYPWSFAFSRQHGRFISGGIGNPNPASCRIATTTDLAISIDQDAQGRGSGQWLYGTAAITIDPSTTGPQPLFPYNSRPSFYIPMGVTGVTHQGSFPGKNTFDDLFAAYPTDGNYDLMPGDPANAGTLSAYIQAGLGGQYPRQEFTGRNLRDLIYWIRTTATAGYWPTPVALGPTNPDVTAPVITITSVTHDAGAHTLTITWNTDKPTFGVALCGSATQQGFGGGPPPPSPYPLWQIEPYSYPPGYRTTGHSATITGLPSVSPIHFSVQVKDIAGNVAHTLDDTVA